MAGRAVILTLDRVDLVVSAVRMVAFRDPGAPGSLPDGYMSLVPTIPIATVFVAGGHYKCTRGFVGDDFAKLEAFVREDPGFATFAYPMGGDGYKTWTAVALARVAWVADSPFGDVEVVFDDGSFVGVPHGAVDAFKAAWDAYARGSRA